MLVHVEGRRTVTLTSRPRAKHLTPVFPFSPRPRALEGRWHLHFTEEETAQNLTKVTGLVGSGVWM